MASAQKSGPSVEMPESKIVATERLRREGRWEEASVYRDQERRRLREEGMSRREANEEAWRLMCETFSPLDEKLFWHFYELAEVPPPICCGDAEGEKLAFPEIWWAFCRLAAFCCWLDPELVDVNKLEALRNDRLQHEPEPDEERLMPTDARRSLLRVVFEDSSEFLLLVELEFRLAVVRIDGTDSHAAATKRELEAYLDVLPEMAPVADDVSAFTDGSLTIEDEPADRMLVVALDPSPIITETTA